MQAATRSGVTTVVTAWTTQQAHTSEQGSASPFDILANADAVLESFVWPGASA